MGSPLTPREPAWMRGLTARIVARRSRGSVTEVPFADAAAVLGAGTHRGADVHTVPAASPAFGESQRPG